MLYESPLLSVCRQVGVRRGGAHVVEEGQPAGGVGRGPVGEVHVEQALVAAVEGALAVRERDQFLKQRRGKKVIEVRYWQKCRGSLSYFDRLFVFGFVVNFFGF